MVTILNKLRQPLPVTISDTETMIFLSRERKDLTFEQYNSPKIKDYIEKGMLFVLEIKE